MKLKEVNNMCETARRLLRKLRTRLETKDFIPAHLTASDIVSNRGGRGEGYRWSFPFAGIASEYTMSDILRCKTPLEVVERGRFLEIDVPNSEMRRLYPFKAERGIWAEVEPPEEDVEMIAVAARQVMDDEP